jgi:plastocyanin
MFSIFEQGIPIQSHAIATTTVSIMQGAQLPDNEKFYGPEEITINPGDIIIWENKDTALHTATSGSGEEAMDMNFPLPIVQLLIL